MQQLAQQLTQQLIQQQAQQLSQQFGSGIGSGTGVTIGSVIVLTTWSIGFPYRVSIVIFILLIHIWKKNDYFVSTVSFIVCNLFMLQFWKE